MIKISVARALKDIERAADRDGLACIQVAGDRFARKGNVVTTGETEMKNAVVWVLVKVARWFDPDELAPIWRPKK